MVVKQATDILREIIRGWPPKLDEEALSQWVRAVEEKHGDGEILIQSEIYPRIGRIVKDGPREADWHYTSGERGQEGERWAPIGMRYSIRFKNTGQELAVIVNHAGEIIGREYADDGRPHHWPPSREQDPSSNEVSVILQGWPKVEPQAYRGGRPPKHDLSEDEAKRIVQDWEQTKAEWDAMKDEEPFTREEFCLDRGIPIEILERAQRIVRET
jgi:hypothetical protein